MNVPLTEAIPGMLRDLLPDIASTGDPAELRLYGDGSILPAAAVFPASREQVQALVRLAGERKLPLVPVSSEPPHSHASASVPGGVMVDFRRMNRMMKIDEVSRYAWLEPGVTFGELVPELNRRGLRLNMPFLPQSGEIGGSQPPGAGAGAHPEIPVRLCGPAADSGGRLRHRRRFQNGFGVWAGPSGGAQGRQGQSLGARFPGLYALSDGSPGHHGTYHLGDHKDGAAPAAKKAVFRTGGGRGTSRFSCESAPEEACRRRVRYPQRSKPSCAPGAGRRGGQRLWGRRCRPGRCSSVSPATRGIPRSASRCRRRRSLR